MCELQSRSCASFAVVLDFSSFRTLFYLSIFSGPYHSLLHAVASDRHLLTAIPSDTTPPCVKWLHILHLEGGAGCLHAGLHSLQLRDQRYVRRRRGSSAAHHPQSPTHICLEPCHIALHRATMGSLLWGVQRPPTPQPQDHKELLVACTSQPTLDAQACASEFCQSRPPWSASLGTKMFRAA